MSSDNCKEVRVYFYYLTVERIKDRCDESVYKIVEVAKILSRFFSFLVEKGLNDRKIDNENLMEVAWLDKFSDIGNGNYNLIFKSAKYNHVRNEIDTITMEELGTRKRPQDADQEKTHLCIRLNEKRKSFLVVHEGNSDGLPIGRILVYLNNKLREYCEESENEYQYKLISEIIPGDDFLEELKKSTKPITLLELTIESTLLDPYLKIADRDSVRKTIKVLIKRPKGYRKMPENLIKSYYENMQSDSIIQRVTAKYSNEKIADTDIFRMKRNLNVRKADVTNEVDSDDFFIKAQNFISQNGGQ